MLVVWMCLATTLASSESFQIIIDSKPLSKISQLDADIQFDEEEWATTGLNVCFKETLSSLKRFGSLHQQSSTGN